MPRYLVEFQPNRQDEVYRGLKSLGLTPIRKVAGMYWSIEAPPEFIPKVERLPGVVRVVEERTYSISSLPVEVKLSKFLGMGGPLNPLALVWSAGLMKDRWPTSESRKELEVEVADKIGVTGRGVKVAVLDTGFDVTIQKTIADYVDSTLEGDPAPVDLNGHSTHVLTTICGLRAPTPWGWLEGVAKGVQVAAVKCLGYGIGTARTSDVIEAIANAYGWGAKIVNLSLGSDVKPGESHDPWTCPLCSLITALSEKGIIFCVAAGNSGKGHASCPGSSPGAITVAALRKDLTVADFSSREHQLYLNLKKPDVGAPGVDVGSSTTGLIDVMEWIDGPRVAFISGTCITKDTVIYTPDGQVELEDLKVGDEVYSFNGSELVVNKVVDITYQGVKEVYELVTFDGRQLIATGNHPILVLDDGKLEWRRLDQLEERDSICLAHNIPIRVRPGQLYVNPNCSPRTARVKSVKPVGKEEVFDLTVIPDSTFVANGMIVHNSMATPHVSGLLALWVEYARRKGVELTRDVVVDVVEHYSNGWRPDVGYGVPKFSWIVDYLR